MDFNPYPIALFSVELSDTGQSFSGFLKAIHTQIKRAQRCPPAVQQAVTDTTQVDFTIRRNGTLVDVKVVTSSGSRVLDGADLAVVQDTAPFPSFPED